MRQTGLPISLLQETSKVSCVCRGINLYTSYEPVVVVIEHKSLGRNNVQAGLTWVYTLLDFYLP